MSSETENDYAEPAEETPLKNDSDSEPPNDIEVPDPTPETQIENKSTSSSSKFNYQNPVFIIICAVLGIGALAGIIAGIVIAVTSGPEEISLPDGTNAYKGDWTDWSDTACSSTCGEGQKTRQRNCITSDDSLSTVVCDANNGTLESFQFELLSCENPVCIAGRVVVDDTIINIRKSMASNDKNFDDKEFLRRYAESVTNYGNIVNVEGNSGGAGIWRLVEKDATKILQRSSKSNRKRRAAGLGLSTDFVINMRLACNKETFNDALVLSSTEEFLKFINQTPCASAAALLTTLMIDGKSIPSDPVEQERLQQSITDQVVVQYAEILKTETEEMMARCQTKDFDFEFLIDSSGSVSEPKWKETIQMIADYWIDNALQPVYLDFGIHVAARWYSSSSGRFINFKHTSFTTSGYKDYHTYLANLMRTEPYHTGGTETALAIGQVQNSDLPTSRRLGKDLTNVIVFTDGQSADSSATAAAAKRLHSSATVYAVGIGNGPNLSELNSIASSGQYSIVNSFADVQFLVKSILNQESTCGEYDCKNIVRKIGNLISEGKTKGCHKATGERYECGFNCYADEPGKTTDSTQDCIECSEHIAKSHIDELNKLEDPIKEASVRNGVDEMIIAGIISKVSSAGSELDEDGYVPCPKSVLDRVWDAKCYGLMRVPVDNIKNFDSIKAKGPRSWEAISEGIKLLADVAKCICESTQVAQRKTKEDIVRINERAIAAYHVGCTNVPLLGNDVMDVPNYDFSNDVIARAQYFDTELFN